MCFDGTMRVILIIGFLTLAWGKPFLYNAPGALIANLASSASASASSSGTAQYTNIADLRRKEEKAEKLQVEKRLIEDDHIDTEGNGADTNEVQPSLIQKKINKLLTKIRFLSTLSGLSRNNREEEELGDFDFDFETTTSAPADPMTFQKVIYPHEGYGTPLRVNLKIGEEPKDNDAETITERDSDEGVEEMQRFGQIGVFFAELLGSLVGLAYGATAQISNALQNHGTTESPGF